GHLFDRFDLEFFRVTLTTHDTSYLGLIMRLGGVYETRGDSMLLDIFIKALNRFRRSDGSDGSPTP
ncbi:hypothetical protein, partial [Pseudomonas guariconensis]|uniref:hypothetical protein n=1 Tax=Pseudomonas guariconensis TaxID=1288410 RepID=UPI00209ABE5E